MGLSYSLRANDVCERRSPIFTTIKDICIMVLIFFGCLVVSGSAKHTGKRFSHSKKGKISKLSFFLVASGNLPLSGSLHDLRVIGDFFFKDSCMFGGRFLEY